jgi:hypothetical protein
MPSCHYGQVLFVVVLASLQLVCAVPYREIINETFTVATAVYLAAVDQHPRDSYIVIRNSVFKSTLTISTSQTKPIFVIPTITIYNCSITSLSISAPSSRIIISNSRIAFLGDLAVAPSAVFAEPSLTVVDCTVQQSVSFSLAFSDGNFTQTPNARLFLARNTFLLALTILSNSGYNWYREIVVRDNAIVRYTQVILQKTRSNDLIATFTGNVFGDTTDRISLVQPLIQITSRDHQVAMFTVTNNTMFARAANSKAIILSLPPASPTQSTNVTITDNRLIIRDLSSTGPPTMVQVDKRERGTNETWALTRNEVLLPPTNAGSFFTLYTVQTMLVDAEIGELFEGCRGQANMSSAAVSLIVDTTAHLNVTGITLGLLTLAQRKNSTACNAAITIGARGSLTVRNSSLRLVLTGWQCMESVELVGNALLGVEFNGLIGSCSRISVLDNRCDAVDSLALATSDGTTFIEFILSTLRSTLIHVARNFYNADPQARKEREFVMLSGTALAENSTLILERNVLSQPKGRNAVGTSSVVFVKLSTNAQLLTGMRLVVSGNRVELRRAGDALLQSTGTMDPSVVVDLGGGGFGRTAAANDVIILDYARNVGAIDIQGDADCGVLAVAISGLNLSTIALTLRPDLVDPLQPSSFAQRLCVFENVTVISLSVTVRSVRNSCPIRADVLWKNVTVVGPLDGIVLGPCVDSFFVHASRFLASNVLIFSTNSRKKTTFQVTDTYIRGLMQMNVVGITESTILVTRSQFRFPSVTGGVASLFLVRVDSSSVKAGSVPTTIEVVNSTFSCDVAASSNINAVSIVGTSSLPLGNLNIRVADVTAANISTLLLNDDGHRELTDVFFVITRVTTVTPMDFKLLSVTGSLGKTTSVIVEDCTCAVLQGAKPFSLFVGASISSVRLRRLSFNIAGINPTVNAPSLASLILVTSPLSSRVAIYAACVTVNGLLVTNDAPLVQMVGAVSSACDACSLAADCGFFVNSSRGAALCPNGVVSAEATSSGCSCKCNGTTLLRVDQSDVASLPASVPVNLPQQSSCVSVPLPVTDDDDAASMSRTPSLSFVNTIVNGTTHSTLLTGTQHRASTTRTAARQDTPSHSVSLRTGESATLRRRDDLRSTRTRTVVDTNSPSDRVVPAASLPAPAPSTPTSSVMGEIGFSDATADATIYAATTSAALTSVAAPTAATRASRVGAVAALATCGSAGNGRGEPTPSLLELPFPASVGSGRLRGITGPVLVASVLQVVILAAHMLIDRFALLPPPVIMCTTNILAPLWISYFGPAVLGYAPNLLLERDATLADVVVAVFATSVQLASMVWLAWVVMRVAPRMLEMRSEPSASRRRVMKSVVVDAPSASRSVPLLAAYGSIIDATRDVTSPRCRIYFVVEVVVSGALAVLTGLGSALGSAAACRGVSVGAALVALLMLAYLVVVRPYRSRLDTAFSIAFALLQVVMTGALAASLQAAVPVALIVAGWCAVALSFGFVLQAVVVALWAVWRHMFHGTCRNPVRPRDEAEDSGIEMTQGLLVDCPQRVLSTDTWAPGCDASVNSGPASIPANPLMDPSLSNAPIVSSKNF